jgi:two-component system NtrC family response regulator
LIGNRILVVDDDESLRRVTQVRLQKAGYEVATAAGGEEALNLLERIPIDLIVTDLNMPGMNGVELLKQVKAIYPEKIVVLVTAYGTVESAVEAMKLGAYDYILKPINSEALQHTVSRALEHERLREEVRNLRTALDRKHGFENIIGRSELLLRTLDDALRAADSDATVLIRGETGTGKELLARGIHRNSPRKDRPFVTINCAAIPKDLLESELFGHVRGAFTGAVAHKKGKVEIADTGTLFLDEIGELPVTLQAKLLRLLQEGEIEKIGATVATRVDVRVVAATHRNLQAMVDDGEFREDLYYRLAVIPLELPPLRDRPEDAAVLAQHFFESARRKHAKPDLALSPAVLPHLCAHRWPGNVRELENLIERLVVLGRGNEITVADLPENLRRERPPLEAIQLELPPNGISLEAVERELILRALRKFGYNQSQAARYLDISRKTLIYRMEKFGIREPV